MAARLTVTLYGTQREELDALVASLNEARGPVTPVSASDVMRLALVQLLRDNRANPLALAKQFALPFDE